MHLKQEVTSYVKKKKKKLGKQHVSQWGSRTLRCDARETICIWWRHVAEMWWLTPGDETAAEEEATSGSGSDLESVMGKGRKPDLMSLCLATLALTRRSTDGKLILRTTSFHRRQINQVRNGPHCGSDKKQSGGGSPRPWWRGAATAAAAAVSLGSVVSRRTPMIPSTICFQEWISMTCGIWEPRRPETNMSAIEMPNELHHFSAWGPPE